MSDDFIGVYENAFSKEFCERTIRYFENMKDSGFTENRIKSEKAVRTFKDDESLFAHGENEVHLSYARSLLQEFQEKMWEVFNHQYAQEYAILQQAAEQFSWCFKVQKTAIGGGYHAWHYETMNRASSNRFLVWILYLNDVEEGGETEFLYQHKRLKPKQGTLVFFPGSFTHTHRGNPPLSNDKYIVTGWIEF